MKELENIKEGTILEQETCDEILMDLHGNTQGVNEHIEHWLVKDETSNGYVLYNLDTQRTWKVKKNDMRLWLRGNKSFGIKPLFKVSKEIA